MALKIMSCGGNPNFYNRYLRTQSILATFTFSFLALLVTFFVTSCNKPVVDERPLSAQEQRGARIYATNCAACHRADSEKPLNGPGLQGMYKRPYLPSGAPTNDERVTEVVKHGRRSMPGFADMTDDEIQALLAYLKRL